MGQAVMVIAYRPCVSASSLRSRRRAACATRCPRGPRAQARALLAPRGRQLKSACLFFVDVGGQVLVSVLVSVLMSVLKRASLSDRECTLSDSVSSVCRVNHYMEWIFHDGACCCPMPSPRRNSAVGIGRQLGPSWALFQALARGLHPCAIIEFRRTVRWQALARA